MSFCYNITREKTSIFILHLADKNRWANIEKFTYLAIDVASLFVGVGMFLRLRHAVTLLSRTGQAMALFNATVQVASGALGTMITLVENEKNSKFIAKLRTVLLVIDLATLGGDFVTNSMLKKASQETLDVTPQAIRSDKRWAEVEGELETLAGLEMRTVKTFPLGVKLEVLSSNLLKKYITELGIKMQKHGYGLEIKWIDEMADLNYTRLQGRVIVNESGSIVLLLRKDCSKMAWFHENIHIEDLIKLGREKYMKMSIEEPWTLEWNVWEGIFKERNKYREVELAGAYVYVKGIFNTYNIPFKENIEIEQLILKLK